MVRLVHLLRRRAGPTGAGFAEAAAASAIADEYECADLARSSFLNGHEWVAVEREGL